MHAPQTALIMMTKPSDRKRNRGTYRRISPKPTAAQMASSTPFSSKAPGTKMAMNMP